MPDDLPFVPDVTLDLVAAGWWLELRCECGRSAYVPHRLLTKRHGATARVPDLLRRFRCETCRRRPVLARWVDRADTAPPYDRPPRSVPLRLPSPG